MGCCAQCPDGCRRPPRARFLTRIGGDEFTLISTGGPQPATAEALADRLHAAVASDLEVDGQQLRTGLSIGIAIYPTDGADEMTLIANADAALYRAKAEGRGRTRFFDLEMDKRLRERRALQHELRSALAVATSSPSITSRRR